jgi:hypothetical protein
MSAAAWIYEVCSAIFATPREAAIFRNSRLTITHPSTAGKTYARDMSSGVITSQTVILSGAPTKNQDDNI